MHPAGIKFGLSHGLLQLEGAGVVLSTPLLESISSMARRKVQRRKRVIWIWDEAVTAGLGKLMPLRIDAPRQEYVPFYTGLDRIIFETLGPIAEKAKIATRYSRNFSSDPLFYRKMRQDIRRPHMRLEANLAWRLQFRETLELVRKQLAEYSPENLRHAELIALCQLDNWDHLPNKLTIEDFLK
jgi:hypothetical protein